MGVCWFLFVSFSIDFRFVFIIQVTLTDIVGRHPNLHKNALCTPKVIPIRMVLIKNLAQHQVSHIQCTIYVIFFLKIPKKNENTFKTQTHTHTHTSKVMMLLKQININCEVKHVSFISLYIIPFSHIRCAFPCVTQAFPMKDEQQQSYIPS